MMATAFLSHCLRLGGSVLSLDFMAVSQTLVPFPWGALGPYYNEVELKPHLAWNYLCTLYYIFHTESKGSLSNAQI